MHGAEQAGCLLGPPSCLGNVSQERNRRNVCLIGAIGVLDIFVGSAELVP